MDMPLTACTGDSFSESLSGEGILFPDVAQQLLAKVAIDLY
jgi:hypothetical protein